jgi:hypothetical protein
VRLGAAVAVLVLAAAAAPRLMPPQALVLLQVVGQLGPISGWRCVQQSQYVYEPSHASPDPTLLADAPEMTVLGVAPGATVDRVEVDLQSGDASVWTRVLADDDTEHQQVYVLSPGRLQAVAVDATNVCYSHLADWKIVGQHDLG